MTAAPTQIQLSHVQPLVPEPGEDSDEGDQPSALLPTARGMNRYLLVNAAGKHGATLHNTDKCWMARSRSFTSLELRDDTPSEGEYKRVCKLCWPNNQLVQEQESSSSESEADSHHSVSTFGANHQGDAESVHDSDAFLDEENEVQVVDNPLEPVLDANWVQC